MTLRKEKETPDYNLYRVIGPPGCGKTTYLSHQVRLAWESGKDVLLCSLTRAAAAELAGRQLPIPNEAIGTLHAHAYRSLAGGFSGIADTPKMIAEWNKDAPEHMQLTTTERDMDEDNADPLPPGETPADQILNNIMVKRARMQGMDYLSSPERTFLERWAQWKEANNLLDFTDLLEVCLREVSHAPNHPQVIFADERQDFSLLETELLYKWGGEAGLVVEAGDPWQNLYEWRGSDPQVFFHGDASEERVLEQSYRVPHAVHQAAMDWIKRMPGYQPIEYRPTEEAGIAQWLSAANYKRPEPLLPVIEDALTQGKSVMYITSCAYMLNPMISVLRKTGIPFHNQYRRKNGRWNPLQFKKGSISSPERLASFLRMGAEGIWTRDDLHKWLASVKCADVLPAKESYQKFKARIDNMPEQGNSGVDYGLLSTLVGEMAIEASMTTNLEWLTSNLLAQRKAAMEFPCAIAGHLGREALLEEPKLTIGTIHSVKGGESDVVIVAPDLSQRGVAQWHSGPQGRAGIFRLFYVAMTRAKEALYVTAPVDSKSAMRLL